MIQCFILEPQYHFKTLLFSAMTQDQSPQKAGFYDHEFEKLNEKSNLHPHLPYHLLYRYTSWLYPPSPSLPWFSTSSIFSFWSYSSHRSLDPRRKQDEKGLDQWGGHEAERPPPSPSLHQVSISFYQVSIFLHHVSSHPPPGSHLIPHIDSFPNPIAA